jgi:hypothetical protein
LREASTPALQAIQWYGYGDDYDYCPPAFYSYSQRSYGYGYGLVVNFRVSGVLTRRAPAGPRGASAS